MNQVEVLEADFELTRPKQMVFERNQILKVNISLVNYSKNLWSLKGFKVKSVVVAIGSQT